MRVFYGCIVYACMDKMRGGMGDTSRKAWEILRESAAGSTANLTGAYMSAMDRIDVCVSNVTSKTLGDVERVEGWIVWLSNLSCLSFMPRLLTMRCQQEVACKCEVAWGITIIWRGITIIWRGNVRMGSTLPPCHTVLM